MMDAHVLEKLRKNAIVYVKDEDGTFIPLGVGSTVSLTQDGCSATTMVLEVQDIPTLKPQKPENIIRFDAEGLTMSTCCSTDLFWQYQPPKFGKSFVEENKIIYTSTADILKEKKEGNKMELLRLYNKKSKENINEYYNKLIDEERKNDVVQKEFDALVDKFNEDIEALAQKYNPYEGVKGSYIIEDECGEFEVPYGVYHERTQKEHELDGMRVDELHKLDEKIEEINAHLQLLPTVETSSHDKVIEILKTYGVVDENGKLTPYTPEAIGDTCCEECKCEEIKHRGRPKKKSN